jgi:hypothetical protein
MLFAQASGNKISNSLSQTPILVNFCSSNISIAKLIAKRAHRIPHRNLRRKHAKIKQVIESSVRGPRRVEEAGRAGHGVLAGLQVLVLPDPPGAVDLCVVQEEVRVAGGGEEVAAW